MAYRDESEQFLCGKLRKQEQWNWLAKLQRLFRKLLFNSSKNLPNFGHKIFATYETISNVNLLLQEFFSQNVNSTFLVIGLWLSRSDHDDIVYRLCNVALSVKGFAHAAIFILEHTSAMKIMVAETFVHGCSSRQSCACFKGSWRQALSEN